MQLKDVLGMVSDAASLFGKGGNTVNAVQACAKAFSEFGKYPKTVDGLKQALHDANISQEDAQKAFSMLSGNPKMKQLIENKFPGSLRVLEDHIMGNKAKISAMVNGMPAPSTPPQNTAIRDLLNRAKG